MSNILQIPTTSFLTFNRKEWATFKNTINDILSLKEIKNLKNINNNLSINEIIEIYLPLSKLLSLSICSNVKKQNILKKILNIHAQHIPYIIGITGSVAVGKSTTAKILQTLLSRWPEHRVVELVATDGFLYSNKILKRKNLINKKGFPQSYDILNLINFISKTKSGIPSIKIPVYSHLIYDVIHNTQQTISKPDILIVEGLNILQTNYKNCHTLSHIFISDFIDFSIYIDAPEFLLQKWYIDRFLKFCHATTISHSHSYFYRYSKLPKNKIISIASQLWTKINELNLQQNILPTRERANLILKKGTNHTIHNIQLKTNNY